MQKWAVSLLLALALPFSSSCQKANEQPPLIRVGHASHDHHAPLYVAALYPDYFRKAGDLHLREIVPRKEYDLVSSGAVLARLTIDSSTGGKELIRKLAEDHFDISFGGVPAMLNFIDRGAAIRIVSPVMAEGAGLVVRKDLPVNNWEEFLSYVKKREKPYRVGYKIGVSVQNLIFERALEEVGIPYGKDLQNPTARIILVNVHGPKNLIPSMEAGIIDGFVIMQPYLAIAEEEEIGKTIAMLSELPPEGRWEGNPCCALAASQNLLDSQVGATASFVALMMKANAFINSHPQETARLVSEWLGVPSSVEESSIPTIRFTTDITGSWERGVDFWIESMIAQDGLDGRVRGSFEEGEHRDLIYDLDLYRTARSRM
jgi:NitT/TauT family transport system substrate-binding protein